MSKWTDAGLIFGSFLRRDFICANNPISLHRRVAEPRVTVVKAAGAAAGPAAADAASAIEIPGDAALARAYARAQRVQGPGGQGRRHRWLCRLHGRAVLCRHLGAQAGRARCPPAPVARPVRRVAPHRSQADLSHVFCTDAAACSPFTGYCGPWDAVAPCQAHCDADPACVGFQVQPGHCGGRCGPRGSSPAHQPRTGVKRHDGELLRPHVD